MNLFSLGAPKVYDLIEAYTIKVGLYGLLFAFVGLILGLILVRLLKKYEWLQRRSEQRRKLIPLYKVIITMNISLFCLGLGGALVSEDYFQNQVLGTVKPMTKLIFPTYQYYLNTNWEDIVAEKQDFKQSVNGYMSENRLDKPSDDLKGAYLKWAADMGMPMVVNWWFKSVVQSAPLNKGQKPKNDPALVKARKVNVYGLRRKQWDVFESFMRWEISHFHAKIMQVFALVLILPIIVILIESYLLKRRRERLASIETPAQE